jgi:hypothetical protein
VTAASVSRVSRSDWAYLRSSSRSGPLGSGPGVTRKQGALLATDPTPAGREGFRRLKLSARPNRLPGSGSVTYSSAGTQGKGNRPLAPRDVGGSGRGSGPEERAKLARTPIGKPPANPTTRTKTWPARHLGTSSRHHQHAVCQATARRFEPPNSLLRHSCRGWQGPGREPLATFGGPI